MGADIFSDLSHKSSIWEPVSSLVAVSRSEQPERPRVFLFQAQMEYRAVQSDTVVQRYNYIEPLDGHRSMERSGSN